MVAATIKTAAIPQNLLCDSKTQHEKNMNWNKATQQQKLKYQQPIMLTMQYDHSKRTVDYIIVIPDLEISGSGPHSNLQLTAGYLDPLFC